ncbi:MAG: LCP family protein [Clostridia bacterium]|nr:LCP family protein [Clostridia bacterium]
MAMLPPKKREFQTARGAQRAARRKFALVFSVAAVLLLVGSVFVILLRNGFDFRTAVGGEEQTETQTAAEATESAAPAGKKTFLLWCAEKSTNRLQAIWLVRCEMPQRRLTALALAPETPVAMGGKGSTLDATFASGGARALRDAVQAMLGAPIDRYVGAYETGLINMVNYMGGLTVDVPAQINYRSDALTLVLVKGQQTLKGDSLFKYFQYLSIGGAVGRAELAQAMLDICAGVFRSQNTEKRSRIFSKMMGTLQTDLSIVDYSSDERAIVQLTQEGFAELVAAPDLAAFSKR